MSCTKCLRVPAEKLNRKEVTWLDEGRLREKPVALTSSSKIIREVTATSHAAIQHTAVWHKNRIHCEENPQQSYNINQQITPLFNYCFNYYDVFYMFRTREFHFQEDGCTYICGIICLHANGLLILLHINKLYRLLLHIIPNLYV